MNACYVDKCGVNAICNARQHASTCSCPPNYTGDPKKACYPSKLSICFCQQFEYHQIEYMFSMNQILHFCCFYFHVQFHQSDLLKLLLAVLMIRNVLIGMLALILNVKTHVLLILVQLKHFVVPTTTKLDALVQKDGQEIQKSNAYLVRYKFIYLFYFLDINQL